MIRSSIAAIVTISITVALFSTSASADSAYNDAAFTFHRNGNTYQRLNLINQQHPQHLQQHLQQQHINGHYNFILQQQKQNKHISSSSLYASFHLNPLPDKLKKLRLPTFSKNVFRRSNRGNLPTSATTCLNQAMSDDDSNSSSRNSKNNDDKTNMEDSNTMELGGGVNGSATTSTVEAPSVLVTSNEEEHDMKNGVIDPNPFLTATTTEHISKNGKTPSDIEGTGSMEPSDSEVETMNGEYEAFNGNEVNGNTNGELIENVDEYEYVDESVMEQSELSRKVVEEIVSPIFGPEIEKGVSQDTIKGALVAGATLTFVTNNFNLNVAAAVALWTAYVSITPGQPGNVARVFGDAAWESTKTVLKASRNLAKALGIRLPFVNTKRSNEDQPALMGKEEIQLDDEIANLVQEVEDTVAEVESVLSDTNAAREAAAEAEQMTEDEAERLAEEARMLELEYLLEEAQIEKDAYEAEMDYLSVEAQIAEEEKMAEEAKLAEEEEARIAEEARLAEEELFDVEEATESAEAIVSEEVNGQVTGGEENDDDDFIDEMEWEASIQLAESLDKTQDDSFDKEEWDAARQLANDLTDETELDYDAPGLSEEERMEKLAQALRAAVDKSEAERQDEEDMLEREQERMIEMKVELQKADILETSNAIADTNGFDTNNGVQRDDQDEPSPDYEKMTVKKLKEILRSQGLKVSGRKAELIERLRTK